jgi:hypothetical protein
LFWTWLRKGYLAVVIGQVFIPVPLWMVFIAVAVLASAIVFMVGLSAPRREENQ